MACNTCNDKAPVALSPDGRYKIQKITKVSNDCGTTSSKVDIYPVTAIQAIIDPCNGDRLDSIISRNNHLYASYMDSEEATYGSIEKKYRRRGLVLTYVDPVGAIVTKQYDGSTVEDADWSNPINWVDFPKAGSSTSTNAYDNTELKEKVKELEGKEDKDTIFDPKDILDKIKELSDEITQLKSNTTTVVSTYDDTELKNAISEIQQKLNGLVDNDTIYDDSAIRELIENLKRLIPVDTNKFIVRGEWIDDNTIRVHFNDDTHLDIAKSIIVTPKFNYTVGPNITSSRPAGQYDKGTQISVSPATIRGKVFSKYVDSVQGDVTTPRHTFTLNEDRSLTVVYNDLPRYTITGVGVTLSDANPFQGETVRVTITTPPGKRFVSVVDSVEGNKGTIANYSFVAQANRTITATFEDIVNPKIYFGHQEGYDTDMSVEATKEASVEVTALPVELSFANIIPVENLGVHGYWGIAVPKELAPIKPTIQTLFNGAWTNMLEGSMNIVEDTIDGKPYWVFMDKTKNRNVNKANEPFKLKVIQ